MQPQEMVASLQGVAAIPVQIKPALPVTRIFCPRLRPS